ncbi:hypothetical protein T11_16125 [Trichinella zimbabwensis]|uniref:Uncharacterized protein n=1 Tax=Trichinella zimbabwensis TaxID=268475 RepID=A0A0V1GFF3_9BILA|nr:hypothetical protein T11_16125 [Trichinella zimbabwensis]
MNNEEKKRRKRGRHEADRGRHEADRGRHEAEQKKARGMRFPVGPYSLMSFNLHD